MQKKFHNLYLYRDQKTKKLGFHTSDKTKAAGVSEVFNHLKTGALVISDYFFTTTKGSDNILLSKEEAINILCKQLMGFERKVICKFGKKPMIKFSGKSHKEFDDTVMALINNVLSLPVIIQRPVLSQQY